VLVLLLMPVGRLIPVPVALAGRGVIVGAVRVAVPRAALCRLPGMLVPGMSGHKPGSLR
jgi:hypothetical protein